MTAPIVEEKSRGLSTLMRAIARGEESALAALYDRTGRLVHGLAVRVLRDSAAAEEVTLDVFLSVWRKAASYSPERGTVVAWLTALARTRAIDRLRASRARVATLALDDDFPLAAEHPGPESVEMDRERGRRVTAALAELPLEQRRAIELAYFGGLSHTEIAATCGVPLGTVKTRIRLGMTKLRTLLDSLADDTLEDRT